MTLHITTRPFTLNVLNGVLYDVQLMTRRSAAGSDACAVFCGYTASTSKITPKVVIANVSWFCAVYDAQASSTGRHTVVRVLHRKVQQQRMGTPTDGQCK